MGNLCFQIDGASLMVGSKFTVLASFYFVFEGFLRYCLGGLTFGIRAVSITSVGVSGLGQMIHTYDK